MSGAPDAAPQLGRIVIMPPEIQWLVRDMAYRELRFLERARELCHQHCRECEPGAACPVGGERDVLLHALAAELAR